ncbi:cysteine hydrolase family protein [Paludibacterium purpuratum]|uniref:Nicotinamidase-related amidase n=1 Tax=Paludibacterium purpuratum TaxID=1144873 RepID=A0A4R7AZL1_9NEIS|nr:cysteine hydrolase family protein [Paludibacterium purpuratum]TDR73869.1 nicotinamidase-related amidase [Paludibacterium purpuratum]
MNHRHSALLVIDLQNDYFPGGAFPLHDADATLDRVLQAMEQAKRQGMPIILVQHVAEGPSSFFNADSEGVAIHPRVLAAVPDAPVIVKHHADSFLRTELAEVLQQQGIEELLVCGMMTQNCVTHTAISTEATPYRISILPDCCTTVSQMLHIIALRAVEHRVRLATAAEALA